MHRIPFHKIAVCSHFIQYTNPENKKKIAILSISAKDYPVKEKIQGATIRKITPGEIIIFVGGKTETIEKVRN